MEKYSTYNQTVGRAATDWDAPIVKSGPIAVTSSQQFLYGNHNNKIPDMFGITKDNPMPMQEITPPSGGGYSGRTGPW